MFRIELHSHIARISTVFYRVGFWHRDDEATVKELRLKFFYSIYYFLYIVSMIAGALGADDIDELIILVEFTLIASVLLIKLLYITWRKKEILQLLNRICSYSVEDDNTNTFAQVNDKLVFLMKFVAIFLSVTYVGVFFMALVIPFLGNEKKLFLSIGFPFDWRNNEFAYWMAVTFISSQGLIIGVAVSFSPIIWYLISNCGLKFEVLGQQIKTMGEVKSVERIGISNLREITVIERDNLYLRDLHECIASHTHLKRLINELESFLSEVLVGQLTTSALCICCSIYFLAFTTGGITVEYLVYVMILLYNIFDIFMILHFGNEIELASDKLTYSLFMSNWMDRPQSTKKIVLIFGEFLMQPHQLVVLKLYPLNLETFTRILNSAYSTFNILKNFK